MKLGGFARVRTRVRVRPSWGLAAWFTLAAATSHAAPFAYITNQGSHDVSVIDLASQRVVATVPVGKSPAGVVAVSRAGRVFVSNPDSRTVSVIDMRSNTVVATLPAGGGPVGIDASADGEQLFVADWYRNRLMVWTLQKPEAAPWELALGRAPAGVAASADGRTVYVAERDDDSVAVVDVATRQVRGRVSVGSHPFALLLDEARSRLFALNVMSDDVSVLDTRTLKVTHTVKVGKAPYGAALASANALLYVTNQHADTVSVIDANSLQLLRTLPGFGYPEGVAAHGDRVYVVNWMDDCVSVLNAQDGRELARINTGSNSRAFGAFIGAPSKP
jgi:YVTN family beta-propeller protein